MLFRVQEPTFWRNYFYRVTIVKQTVLSNPPAEQELKKDDSVLFDFKDDESEGSEDDEVIVQEKIVEKKTSVVEKKEVPIIQTKEENYEGMEDWEIELRKAAI